MIAICTSCTPWFPLPDLLPRLAAAGYHGIELGVRSHTADASRPPDFWNNNHAVIGIDALEAMLPALEEALVANRMRLAAIGGYHHAHELAVQQRIARIAQRLGCSIVRALVPAHDPATGYAAQLAEQRALWRTLASLGADHGVRFCIELHDYTMTPSASALRRVLDGCDERGCGAILDAANTVAEGNEAMPMLIDILGQLLAHVHVKQRTFRRSDVPTRASLLGMPISPLAEPGDIAWPEIAALLRAAGYAGWWSVENFTHIGDPDGRLATDADWMRRLLA